MRRFSSTIGDGLEQERAMADGRWLVVFDKGSPPDPPAK
jgi:hypothetical protein